MKLDEARPDLLVQTPEGSLRIAGTRITLDAVIQSFHDGGTPEEICQDFPTLSLAQVYDLLAFYLNHREDVDRYLTEQTQLGATIQQELRSQYTIFLADLRHRLAARRSSPTSHA